MTDESLPPLEDSSASDDGGQDLNRPRNDIVGQLDGKDNRDERDSASGESLPPLADTDESSGDAANDPLGTCGKNQDRLPTETSAAGRAERAAGVRTPDREERADETDSSSMPSLTESNSSDGSRREPIKPKVKLLVQLDGVDTDEGFCFVCSNLGGEEIARVVAPERIAGCMERGGSSRGGAKHEDDEAYHKRARSMLDREIDPTGAYDKQYAMAGGAHQQIEQWTGLFEAKESAGETSDSSSDDSSISEMRWGIADTYVHSRKIDRVSP